MMSNWQNEYRVKYRIALIHNDGRSTVKADEVIIEGRSITEVETTILAKFEHDSHPLIDLPDGWFGHISSEELEIFEVSKIWEY